MEDFKLQLTGELDQNKSKTNINSDLVKIASAIDKLKVQAEIDQNSVKQIAQQLSNIMNQKVVVNNIQIDTTQASKAGEQAGQNIGDSLTKRLQSSLNVVKQNIENTIRGFGNQKLNSYDLTKMFNLNRSGIDASVIQNVRNLTNELNALAKEALKTNSDGSWEGIVNKISSLSKVLTQFGSGRDLTAFKESLDVLDYFQNKKIFVGSKDDVLANTGLSVKELNNQFRNLGVTFTTVKENSLQLDTIWEELFRINPNFQQFTNFGDQINAIVSHLKIAKEAMYGDSNLQPLNSGDVNKVLLDWLTNLENVSKKVNVFRGEQEELERRLAQSSTSSTNTVVQNEQKKQHAYQQTANAKKKVAESESLIKNNANVTTFAQSNNAARIARDEFEQLLQAENAVISVTERFGKNNNLTSFSLNIKRATGEVETLRYALENIGDKQNPLYVFKNSGAELNNSGAIKQIQAIENAFASFTQKIEQFKSTNHDKLSGIAQPLADFESKLNGLKTGTSTINEVKNAYKLLQAEVSKIDAPLKATIDRFSATKTAVDNGKKSISDYRETLKGLNNAPKELSQELTKASKLLMQINGIEKKEGTTANWSVKAREFTDLLDSIKGKITSLQKQQANGSTTTVYSKKDIENLLYVQKVMNTISKTEGELRTKLAKAGYTDIKIKGIEDATGKVKELEVTANNAAGALEKINFSRVKVQGGGKSQKIQDWLVQSGDVQVIKSATTAQEELTKSAQRASSNLADLKSKWESQGILVGDFKTKVEQLESSLATVGSKGELDKLTSQIRTLKTEASQIAEVNKIQLLSNGGIKNDYATQIAKLEGDFRSLGLAQDTITTKTQNVKNSLATLRAEFAKPVDQQNFQAIQTANDNLQRELIESRNEFEQLRASMKGMATEQQRLSLANTIEAWNQKNTAATKAVREENERYVISLRDLSNQMTRMDFNKINTGFKQNENSMRALNRLGASLKDQFAQAYRSFTMWLSASTMVMKVISETREAFTELKKINTILTEISKANENLTKDQLTQIGNNSFDIASKYGKTATDFLSGVQEASRAGYENAEAMAELSTAAQGAGDMTADVANQFIIATDKAYKLGGSIEELTEIMDGVNYITNHNAVNMTELSEGMTIVASTASSLGVDVDELTAALGTMSATTQQSGSEVARAFKAILLNIRQVSDEEEGIDAEGLTKYEKACNALGVSLKETRNGVLQTRDAMEVLEELSEAYVKLDENDLKRANLLNSVGGKLRSTQLDALLMHFEDTYKPMLEQFANGENSMAREAEKTANSWEGSLNRLKNSWADTIENIADSESVIAIINGLNGIISGVNKLTDTLGSLGSIGLGAGIFAGFKNVGKRRSTMFHNCFEYADRDRCSLYKIGFLSPIVKYTLVNEATISVEII